MSTWTTIGAILAGLGVVASALAAHQLDDYFAEKYAKETRKIAGQEFQAGYKYLSDFQTAAEYQIYHGLALVAVGLLVSRESKKMLHLSGWIFLLGIILFSGSIYALTTSDLHLALAGVDLLAVATPVGGGLFILAWLLFATGACPCGRSARSTASSGPQSSSG